MSQFLYETHCHSCAGSACASITPEELVREYHRAGYAGLVLTDHFFHGNTAISRDLPWEAWVKGYCEGYFRAQEAAKTLDFDVLFGIEHAYGNGYEVLCYGLSPEDLLHNPQLPDLELEDFALWVHGLGGIVVQAHPYRYSSSHSWLRKDILDGVEVFNAGLSPEQNAAAAQAARSAGLLETSGADTHHIYSQRIGKAGIWLPYRVTDSKLLAQAMKAKQHRLL